MSRSRLIDWNLDFVAWSKWRVSTMLGWWAWISNSSGGNVSVPGVPCHSGWWRSPPEIRLALSTWPWFLRQTGKAARSYVCTRSPIPSRSLSASPLFLPRYYQWMRRCDNAVILVEDLYLSIHCFHRKIEILICQPAKIRIDRDLINLGFWIKLCSNLWRHLKKVIGIIIVERLVIPSFFLINRLKMKKIII